jgi:hypothetical protein
VNSAGATSYFDGPTSLGSLLYPLILANVNTGVNLGQVRLNSRQAILGWIGTGKITTDGGETRLAITATENGLAVCAAVAKSMTDFVHHDFSRFSGRTRRDAPSGDIYRVLPVAKDD